MIQVTQFKNSVWIDRWPMPLETQLFDSKLYWAASLEGCLLREQVPLMWHNVSIRSVELII